MNGLLLMASNKTVLFICPDFFDYKSLIAEELSKHFDKVLSYADRPACSSISKAMLKYNFPLYSTQISKKYCDSIYDSIRNELPFITHVIIVKGTCINPCFLDLLRKDNNKIKVISYSWDSIFNIRTFISLAEKSDYAFTFDVKDSLDYKLDYLPLFYSEVQNNRLTAVDDSVSYEYSFIGSYHGDRVSVLSRFFEHKKEVSKYIKIYFQSRLQYFFYFLRDSSLRNCPRDWITFEPIPRNTLEAISAASCNIIDIHHPKQTGLTMRTWETLQGHSRLITTNPAILLHTKNQDVTVIERATGLEWSSSQCEAYKENINREEPHLKNMGCLSLSAWVNALLHRVK